jgi:Domain of unknown function (DUF4157)
MGEAAAVQTQSLKPVQGSAVGPLLQRKCSCGRSSGLTGSCSECETKKLLGKPLQTKLRITEPGDDYEQEADRAADQVMRMTYPYERRRPAGSSADVLVQRRVIGSTAPKAAAAPSIAGNVLSSPGKPLDQSTRSFFEPRFGWDFGKVRIFADGQASQSAADLNAEAYVVENKVVFAPARYRPHVPEGQWLLAHDHRRLIAAQSAATANPDLRIPYVVIDAETGIAHLDAAQTNTGGTTIEF